jgi:hypothetical protein
MARSFAATAVQFALAFLVGLPIFAAFKLAGRLFSRSDSASGQGAAGGGTLA